MKDPNGAICALCLKTAELQYSHIISEFLYLPVYDGKHRFQLLSTTSGQSPREHQKGIREYLLCRTCEGRVSKWETYAAAVINGSSGLELEYRPFARGFSVSKVDYCAFKLFSLSLLWRASISRLKEFANVQLGPHEERIRTMLLAGDPGKFWEYGFLLNHPPAQALEVFGKTLVIAGSIRYEKHRVHRFLLGVTAWNFFVSNQMQAIDKKLFSLKEDGELTVRNGGDHMMKFFVNLSGEIAANPRNRTVSAKSSA